VWHLMGRRTDRPWDAVAGGPDPTPMPAEGGPLTPDELRAVVEWIDFGASWDASEAAPSDSESGGQR
jgi:hypothetical protein